ncbi:N-alpha-acetyltransferase 50 [Blyttiomyces sp. JEL0837]|nr:N-alpha-acetyltransferase 50 [Blyttiomyces sp. JEL0837]
MAIETSTTKSSASKPHMTSKYFRRQLGDLTLNNQGQLKVLHDAVFLPESNNNNNELDPVLESNLVSNPDKFYKDAVDSGELSKMVYFNDCPVGAIICKRELITDSATTTTTAVTTSKKGSGGASGGELPFKIEVLTLCVLEPYRRLGLATMLLSHIYEYAVSEKRAVSIKFPLRVKTTIATTALKNLLEANGYVKGDEKDGDVEVWEKVVVR